MQNMPFVWTVFQNLPTVEAEPMHTPTPSLWYPTLKNPVYATDMNSDGWLHGVTHFEESRNS